MLDSDIDPLLDVSVAHALVYDYAHGALGDVVDDSGFSVVNFVWHTVDCQRLNIPNTPHSSFGEIRAEPGGLGA